MSNLHLQFTKKIKNHFKPSSSQSNRYYIQKIKPLFVNENIYYEVTVTPANDYASKFDRIIAFSKFEIIDNYSVNLTLEHDDIQMLGKTMPILIITAWNVSIRNCEYSNFSKIVTGHELSISNGERMGLENYMTKTGFNLVDIVSFSDERFNKTKSSITHRAKVNRFFDVLDKCRNIIKNKKPGTNMLRYLLYHMKNTVIKNQFFQEENQKLSNLHLKYGCIPFDNMPFVNFPMNHIPRIGDLFLCLSSDDRKHELLARLVRNNAELKGQLFTTVTEITGFTDIPNLVQRYNTALWPGHRNASKLVIENGQIFINGYKEDCCNIIKNLKKLATSGIKNYSNSMAEWLDNPNNGVDCDEKKEALLHMFEQSKVAFIYGSAGTGKSTLINHIAHFFSERSKLFLAQTNPAVDNLKRRVTASNSNFMTITKFNETSSIRTKYDLLVIDECSTVSNREMKKLLSKASYNLLVLVGDSCQISSIRFGNWFSIAKAFVPSTSVSELMTPFRSNDTGLLTLWKRVRNMDGAILEALIRNNYSVTLDASIFDQASENEIILCLNYDGLYGINNINRFLQESNPSPAVVWGVQIFKINDPILFNESKKLGSSIYNNMKGRIVDIEILEQGTPAERIKFDVAIDRVINETETWGADFELLDNAGDGNCVIRFCVNKLKSTDEDDNSSSDVVPFQIAYAVSIHKSQGLEYKSVKIVITDEVDELITHNIFYTAITRAQQNLKIYWTPEVENKVLSSIQPMIYTKDLGLLRNYLQ